MLLLQFKIDILSNHIDHLEITNFKSIRHAKIFGCKRINVFIGYPNVGKSNILEAISVLSYLEPDYNENYSKLCRIKGSSELFFDGNFQENVSVNFSDKLKIGFKYINELVLDFSIIETDSIEHIIEGNSTTLYSETTLKNLRFSDKNVDRVKNDLKKVILKVKKYHFPSTYNYNDYKTNGLSLFFPFGENLADIVQANKKLRKEVSELFKFYDLKLSIEQANNSIKALKQLDDETIFLIPFYQMADTLQRLIFHKAAIMSNVDSVLLFEEPEAHMFPPYISQLTSDIIFEKGNGNQYFISTHSPFVMNDFLESAREDLSVYLVGLKKGETVIKRLSDEEVHKIYQFGVDLFFNIESYLD